MAKTAGKHRPTKATGSGKSHKMNGKPNKKAGPSWGDVMKKQKKDFDKAKQDAKEGRSSSFDMPDIEDGSYAQRITAARCGFTKKDSKPYFSLNAVIVDGPYAGTTVPLTYLDLSKDWARASMYRILDTLGYDVDSIEIEEIPELCREITKERPVVDTAKVTSDTINEKTGEPFVNFFINGLLDSKDYDDEEEGNEGTEEDENEEEESEDEETDEEEEEEDEAPRARRVSRTKKTAKKKPARR